MNVTLPGLEHPIPSSATVIDIGANAGYFTLFAVSRFADAEYFLLSRCQSIMLNWNATAI